jgi:ketopantoate reductase
VVVIGAGRVGLALKRRSEARGTEPVVLVDRDRGDDALRGAQGDPILVAVRNDDLPDVIARVPTYRREDLVFIQNGAIRDQLRAHSLASATRGLLYFAVASREAEVVPGLVSPFCGPHALAMARFLSSLGLEAHAMDWGRFSYYELEKLLWLATHGLLCQAHRCTVGELVARHREELRALVAELCVVGRAAWGVDADPDYVTDRLVAYSETIPTWPAAVKEWRYRNGWLRSEARRLKVPTPLHDAWIDRLQVAPEDAPVTEGVQE